MPERDRVAAIGGLGRMGDPTKRLFEEAGYSVIISDVKDPKTVSPREAIENSGIVFFTILPIENINDIVRSNAEVFNNTHLVLDNASLKNPIRQSYETLDQKGISICSTHPLCKEDQPFYGQNVLIAPFGHNPHEATLVAKQIHEKAGMVLI
ncbi:MAG: prephenate dehydrogenase/arogenate dehydrogenase family protein, partial [bacterium]|nr:prephenate dehydrogenase/arogenate dehydrogenase family protein [bacterium]